MYKVTGLLGLALIAAPYLVGYATNAPAYWTSMVIGGIIVFVSFIEALDQYDMWEYWVAGIAGVLAVAAPFVFGFDTNVTAMRFIMSAGVLVAVLSGVIIYHDVNSHRV